MKFNRDRTIGFVLGFLVGIASIWLSTVLRIPFWINAIVLVALIVVGWPLVRSRLANRNAPDRK